MLVSAKSLPWVHCFDKLEVTHLPSTPPSHLAKSWTFPRSTLFSARLDNFPPIIKL
jgi:hypothetical protein